MASPKVSTGKKESELKAVEKAKKENAPVVKEKETKKLDDLKETPENKAAIAEAEGKKVEVNDIKKTKEMVKTVAEADPNEISKNIKKETGKKESKPAVAKVDKKNKKDEVKVELEREYIVPLKRGVLNVPHYRRAKKAVRVLKEFMVKHMQVRDRDLRKVKVDINLNNELWFRGIKKPANKIKVKAKKIDGIVYVELADVPEVVKFAIARKERRAAAAVVDTKKSKKVKEEVVADKDKDGVADKKEEAENKKAGTEKAAKDMKVASKNVERSTKGAHAQKTMPVRKVLK